MRMVLLMVLMIGSMAAMAGDEEVKGWDEACGKGEGLACAKLGYRYKKLNEVDLAFDYYQKGCELKDESSCYNLKNVSPRHQYFKKLDSLMSFNTGNITNCYVPDLGIKRSTTQLKEKWYRVRFDFHINQEGKADLLTLNTDLPAGFVTCAKRVVANISFPKPAEIDPSYGYTLSLVSYE